VILTFVLGAALSLGASAVLVTRLERVGARLGLSEALLGLVAAVAADAPEITSAITALTRGQRDIGVGVVLGSNAFNLAALLGLGAVLAGRVRLHREVILLEGVVGLSMAAVSVAAIAGLIGPAAGLGLVLVIFVPYVMTAGLRPSLMRRLPLPRSWVAWVLSAVAEEESELSPAIHPRPGHAQDLALAIGSVIVVVGASVAMERSASALGARLALPGIVVGAIVLAAVTSLPNAVAAIYLAKRDRSAAVLSVAMNSNTLNVVVGLFVPAVVLGLGKPSGDTTLVAAWYAGLSVLTLALAYLRRGLGRLAGSVVIVGYLAFVVVVVVRSLGR
jgi:cation:H+ antiporter